MPKHADLIKILGIKNPTTISEILGERQNIHQPEWEKFKAHFNISELDSDISVSHGTLPQKNNSQQDHSKEEIFLNGPIKVTAQEYVDALKSDKERLEESNKKLQDVIAVNLEAMQLMLDSLRRHDQSFHETMLRSLARLEKKKPEDSLIVEAHTRNVALQLEEQGSDTLKADNFRKKESNRSA